MMIYQSVFRSKKSYENSLKEKISIHIKIHLILSRLNFIEKKHSDIKKS